METTSDEKEIPPRRLFPRWIFWALFIFAVLAVLYGVFLPPMYEGILKDRDSAAMQQSRTIALAMFQYANDNDGKYPEGKSSTEVFQKLIVGNYVSDPSIFYVPLPGKTQGQPGERLKQENVSFDVTEGANTNSSPGLPLVFLTGYKVDYRPGGKAVSLIAPYPPYTQRSWSEWGKRMPKQDPGPFLAACYVSNSAFGKKITVPPVGYGYVPNFVPTDFDAQGKTYRQLTPEGPLK